MRYGHPKGSAGAWMLNGYYTPVTEVETDSRVPTPDDGCTDLATGNPLSFKVVPSNPLT